ncbi:methyltransferase [Chlorobaculum sp. 24CR]|uniref:methyltransferase n=1 Tax=Chlorobaculum sp. 24CR TaxID=2508878 RepID=UPI00100AD2B1|nr:methyltransferase [Chlorobaculum sp. 24CR]RXK80447.1 methyltransferase [Chlorobaculum sp. 24CR]
MGSFRTLEPVSRKFGFDRGTPVDRMYMDHFLQMHKTDITGHVLEVGDNQYTKKYGHNIKRSVILRGNAKGSECYDGDLTDQETLKTLGQYDCLIATQVFNFIFDVPAAIKGLDMLLRKGGTGLITVAGLSQISRYDFDRWGDYWRFTTLSAKKLFDAHFGAGKTEIKSYGNVLVATGFIQGMAGEEFSHEELFYIDPDYQIMIAIKIKK